MEEKELKNEKVTEESKPVAEEKNEEIEVINQKEEEPVLDEKDGLPIDFLNVIEESRQELYQAYKKQNVIKIVVSLLGIGVLIFAFIGVPNIIKGEEYNTLRISLMVVMAAISLLIMFTYSFVVRRSMNKKLRTYFDTLYETLNKYHFDGELELLEGGAKKTLEKIQFDEAYLYKNVIQVNSRNVCDVKYHGLNFLVADAGAKINNGKSMQTIFVGKFFIAPANYNDEQIIVYLKGDKRSIPPTNIDDIKLVFDDEKMSVYSNNENWNKVVNAKFKQALFQIKPDNTLIDVAVSIRDGKVFVCLGYDDDLMIIPLEKPFNPTPNKEYKEDLLKTVKFIELLNK